MGHTVQGGVLIEAVRSPTTTVDSHIILSSLFYLCYKRHAQNPPLPSSPAYPGAERVHVRLRVPGQQRAPGHHAADGPLLHDAGCSHVHAQGRQPAGACRHRWGRGGVARGMNAQGQTRGPQAQAGMGDQRGLHCPHRQIFQKWVCLVLLPELLIVMHYRSPRLGTKLLPY